MPTLDPPYEIEFLHAFAGYGIELEYMIVDRATMRAKPIADVLLHDETGEVVNEVAHGDIAWSNELVRHVVELKTNGPAPTLDGLGERFHRDLVTINRRLETEGACLLPGAAHPLFEPDRETVLWPFGQNEIYAAYDRIFGCRGHGWSNLQSMHINLPFATDEEFTRLHAAIRVALPLIPALSAASPYLDGRFGGWLDNRLRFYRDNQKAVPAISGRVVPEPVTSIEDYHARILLPMYDAVKPLDPDGVLNDDWLNSRGAIARFERRTLEIRIIDLQEAPSIDLAIAEAVVALVRVFYDGRVGFDDQQAVATEALSTLLFDCAARGPEAVIDDAGIAALYRVEPGTRAADALARLLERGWLGDDASGRIALLLEHGPLAARLYRALGDAPSERELVDACTELAACLAENRPYRS
ncbi:glutamate--cysteine ligase [Wenzhouxiangella sp. XN79A]|uniref:carboxylate-amine ligase n=1 Tax=Wenzhouxiangella sp. XN79A TaxID=2724193 RepID=UPI00144ABB36|nr:glutamate-cysteine ligase family protein [Wenzhouxiangella sp. XN79A]NKI36242.1 glutamate--cysteine ligase [Wenzhouxiangella sp. XN79A]